MRKAIVSNAILAALVLLVNLILLVVGIIRFKPSAGMGVMYTGSCDRVKHWDTALHVLINVMGTALLGASSFTMQCLSSPTRFDVDRAHAMRKTLDIGVASVKNLSRLDWKRGLLWWMLALSSVPLHLFWNSTVFSTLQANEYYVIVVSEQFLHDGSNTDMYNDCAYNPDPRTMGQIFSSAYESYQSGGYNQRLEPSECIDTYGATFVTKRRNVLAITVPVAGTTRMIPGCVPGETPGSSDVYNALWNGSSVLGFGFAGDMSLEPWICCGYDTYYDTYCNGFATNNCNAATAQSLFTENGTWYIRFTSLPEAWPVDYCLSDDGIPEKCELHFSSYTLGIVIAFNLVKVVSMIAAVLLLWNLETPVFATVGDAVASYLERPDISAVGRCLMGRTEVKAWCKGIPDHQDEAIYKAHRRKTLFAAVSKTRWFTTMGLATLYLAGGVAFCCLAVSQAALKYTTSEVWKLGLGQIDPDLLIWPVSSHDTGTSSSEESVKLLACILVANSFQLLLSVTYFLYNSLYTAQCGAIEWSSYTIRKNPLRVSWPRGQQKSTYWLHLPYRYGIPLMGALTLMHFLISQAVFLARVQYYSETGSLDTMHSFSGVGFSPISILASCCVGAVLILAQLLHSLRPIQGGIPLHGNKSIAISAACHPRVKAGNTDQSVLLEDAHGGISLGAVMWGAEVQPKHEGDVGHCTFTAEAVELPRAGHLYE